jgi:DHA1 family putative efflux transporter-like MFS transporter
MIGNALHVLVLAALPVATGSLWATGALLLLWSLSAWSSAAPQQLRISSIDPPSADVLIGLNQSTMQLAIAAGAAIGGALIPAIGIDRLPWAAVALVLTSGVLHVAASREPGRAAAGRPRDGLPAA